jgi:DNA-binding transcriptional LysR family regulator
MDISQLLAFERVVREGNFSRAARTLNITQPTISARVQALEHELGGPLFVRGRRRLALTELGESFLPYARRALEVLAEGVEAARLAQVGQRGRVTVGMLPSLASGFLATAVAQYHTTHPTVELFVRTGHSDQVIAMLHDGVARVGLISWPFFDTDLVPVLHFREPLVLVVPAHHPLTRQPVTLEDVQQLGNPLLLVRWGVSMMPVLAHLNTQAGPVVEVPIETVLQLLRRGVGAAFLTRTLVADDLAARRLVEVPVASLPPLVRESVLVRLARDETLPAVITEFVAVLRDAAGALVVAT